VNILGLLPGVLRTIGHVVGINIFDQAADALKNLNVSPEQQVELDKAMKAHEEAMESLSIEKLKTVLSETNAMLASSDKYVSRARPTGLYVAYLCSIAMTVTLIIGTHVDAAAILTLMAPLYGAQGYYMHLRTKEKLNGNGDEK
jgi:uncharacterized membrane protein